MLQVAIIIDDPHLFGTGRDYRFLRASVGGTWRRSTAARLVRLGVIGGRRCGRTLTFFYFLQAQHPFHFRDGELVHGIVTEGLAKSVVSSDVITLFRQRTPLLHEALRPVEDGATIIQLILGIRWVGSDGQYEL